MSKADFSVAFLARPEQRPAGRSHLCCAPPPQPPSALRGSPLLLRAKPRGAAPSPGRAPAEPGAGQVRALPAEPPRPAPEGGWLSADESSGYESESAASGAASPPQPRRLRTAFTSTQICQLEKTFKRQKYLGAAERRKLAAALQLSEVQVKTWFQNRRMKLKRQIQDHHHSLLPPAPFYSYSQGTPPTLLQDYSHYPLGPQQQRLLPLPPSPALQLNSSFQVYDLPQNASYGLVAHDLPYYHQHFLPQLSLLPVFQNKMEDKQFNSLKTL
ncbi:homeobox protein vent1-like [Alligator mississippiensis]|uniref:homeobox protein vent1-like n=1 Tax=Alligator mississippiensis TaxID=8496 RepID=UPI0028774794|nr:homeobox protein vent1-like [Alligator mississippiensis]